MKNDKKSDKEMKAVAIMVWIIIAVIVLYFLNTLYLIPFIQDAMATDERQCVEWRGIWIPVTVGNEIRSYVMENAYFLYENVLNDSVDIYLPYYNITLNKSGFYDAFCTKE